MALRQATEADPRGLAAAEALDHRIAAIPVRPAALAVAEQGYCMSAERAPYMLAGPAHCVLVEQARCMLAESEFQAKAQLESCSSDLEQLGSHSQGHHTPAVEAWACQQPRCSSSSRSQRPSRLPRGIARSQVYSVTGHRVVVAHIAAAYSSAHPSQPVHHILVQAVPGSY